MTNKQIVETKKWNKLSVGVFCASIIFYIPPLYVFSCVSWAPSSFDVFRFCRPDFSLLLLVNLETVVIISGALLIFSIITIIQARKLNQRGVYLSAISIILNSLFIFMYTMFLVIQRG